jgi:hypothetical protein
MQRAGAGLGGRNGRALAHLLREHFQPARVKVHAMQVEMPKKYWRNLPEATLIPELLHEAPRW